MPLRANILITILFCVILTLWITSYVITNIYQVVDEFELNWVNKDITKYQRENLILRNKILEAESLHTIAGRAKESGYIPATIIYLR